MLGGPRPAQHTLYRKNPDIMSNHFDIIILGGGNAGFGVSAIAAEAGKSIAFVEQLDFGGT